MESGHHGECQTWYCREGRQHDRAGFGLTRLCACSLRSDGPRPHIEGSVERRHKRPSLMLLSALASFGMGVPWGVDACHTCHLDHL